MIIDPLYGQIGHGPDDELAWDLYRTSALARLRDISLSSVPSRMSATGEASSRFEHSVGVAYLARELCRRRPTLAPYRNELIAAALLHDSASVPFSHTAEIFQHDLTGRTHEQAVADVLQAPEIAKILRRHKVDPERVLALIEGRHPQLSGLLAGSIDLDNLDNSARLLRAFGAVQEPPYRPEQLAEAFRMRSGRLGIDAAAFEQLAGWRACREQLYGEVLYGAWNLAAASMLYRALETAYAAGRIGSEFFGFGESEAIVWLRQRGTPASRELVEAALRWHVYKRVFEQVEQGDDGRITRLASDWRARKKLADTLAKRLGVRRAALCVYAGKDKGARAIGLPFFGSQAQACERAFGAAPLRYRLAVFVAEDVKVDPAQAEAELRDLLAAVEPAHSGHFFF